MSFDPNPNPDPIFRPSSALTFTGPRPFIGNLRVPGDRHISHRALMLAALSSEPCDLHGLSPSRDVKQTASALHKLGAEVTPHNSRFHLNPNIDWSATIRGGLCGAKQVIDLGESEIGFRLLAGLLAGYPASFTTVLDGNETIRRRSLGGFLRPLLLMQADIYGRMTYGPGDLGPPDFRRSDPILDSQQRGLLTYAPLVVTGCPLRPINFALPAPSAELKSAILLAGLRADGPTTVSSPVQTQAHTEELLQVAGVPVHREGPSVTISPIRNLQLPDMQIPRDPSLAALWLLGACITPESDLTIERVYCGPARNVYIGVLLRMGADITQDPITGDIRARYSQLQATRVTAEEIPSCMDELPILTLAAAAAEGTTIFEKAGGHDPLANPQTFFLQRMLSRMGLQRFTQGEDLHVVGIEPGTRATRPDARIMLTHNPYLCMAAAIAGTAGLARVSFPTRTPFATRYPGFLDDLTRCTGWER